MPDDKLYLPEHFDGKTASQIAAELLKRRGTALELNAEKVKSAGALGLQVLAATCRQWHEDKHAFEVLNPSEELIQASTALGLTQADLGFSDRQVAS